MSSYTQKGKSLIFAMTGRLIKINGFLYWNYMFLKVITTTENVDCEIFRSSSIAPMILKDTIVSLIIIVTSKRQENRPWYGVRTSISL